MRLPFIQLESDLIAHGAPEVAALAGCQVPVAIGHIAMVRAWAVSMADDSAPPDGWIAGEAAGRRIEAAAQWTGERGRLLQALKDAGQVRDETGGIRVLHLEPYAKAWEQNAKSKERMRMLRERSTNNHEQPSGDPERSTKFGGQTQTQTQKEETDLPHPASASAGNGQGELLPDVPPTPPVKPAKKAKEAKKPEAQGDPRHSPLIASLTAEGWPFDGGKDAAHVKALLALADQQEATRGKLAGLEILRRARIAWAQFPSYHSARTLSGLRSKWGEFATPENGGGEAPDGLRPTAPGSCHGCGASGQGGAVGDPEVWLGYECGCLPAFTDAQSKGLHFTKAAEWAAMRKRAA